MNIVPTPSHPHPSPLPEGEGIYGEVACSTKPTSTSGDYVLLRYIETPQVKSFTLPSLGSHGVRVREHGVQEIDIVPTLTPSPLILPSSLRKRR